MTKHYLQEQADLYLEAADRCSLRGDKAGERFATIMALRRLDAHANLKISTVTK